VPERVWGRDNTASELRQRGRRRGNGGGGGGGAKAAVCGRGAPCTRRRAAPPSPSSVAVHRSVPRAVCRAGALAAGAAAAAARLRGCDAGSAGAAGSAVKNIARGGSAAARRTAHAPHARQLVLEEGSARVATTDSER
jgi:hypothetical protein